MMEYIGGMPPSDQTENGPREGKEFAQGHKARLSLDKGPGLWIAGVSVLGLSSQSCPPPHLVLFSVS